MYQVITLKLSSHLYEVKFIRTSVGQARRVNAEARARGSGSGVSAFGLALGLGLRLCKPRFYNDSRLGFARSLGSGGFGHH